jgi:hypothetical protein
MHPGWRRGRRRELALIIRYSHGEFIFLLSFSPYNNSVNGIYFAEMRMEYLGRLCNSARFIQWSSMEPR